MQNCLVLQLAYKHCKEIATSDHISTWKSKRLSGKSNKQFAESNYYFGPDLNYISTKIKVR